MELDTEKSDIIHRPHRLWHGIWLKSPSISKQHISTGSATPFPLHNGVCAEVLLKTQAASPPCISLCYRRSVAGACCCDTRCCTLCSLGNGVLSNWGCRRGQEGPARTHQPRRCGHLGGYHWPCVTAGCTQPIMIKSGLLSSEKPVGLRVSR